MKEVMNENLNTRISKKSTFKEVWENQHPVMYWWFALTSISFCSVYAMLLTKL